MSLTSHNPTLLQFALAILDLSPEEQSGPIVVEYPGGSRRHVRMIERERSGKIVLRTTELDHQGRQAAREKIKETK
jgi:hypothetical protein